jgi:hypothetical protein
MKGVLLRVDGNQESITLPKNWLVPAQKLIGGYIEAVNTTDGRTLLVDADGKIKGKVTNLLASSLYAGDFVVGNAILLNCRREDLD